MNADLSNNTQQAVDEPLKDLEANNPLEAQRQLEEQLLRARADLENLRRRHTRECQELGITANASLIEGLLPIMDTLQLGLETACKHPEAKNITEGFELVNIQLKGFLESKGLEQINPQDEVFDPQQHECVSYVAHPDIPEDHISQVVRMGYTFHGRLLRPATVIVSKGSES